MSENGDNSDGARAAALDYYQRQLRLIANSGNSFREALVLEAIGEIEQDQGNVDAAEQRFSRAANLLETVRTSLGGLSAANWTRTI